jgi:hypothetical protein
VALDFQGLWLGGRPLSGRSGWATRAGGAAACHRVGERRSTCRRIPITYDEPGAAAQSRSTRWVAAISAAAERCRRDAVAQGPRPWVSEFCPEPGRRLGQQALEPRTLRQRGSRPAGASPGRAGDLGPRGGEAGGPRGGRLRRRGGAQLPHLAAGVRRAGAQGPAGGGRRHGSAAPGVRRGDAGGGHLRPHGPRAQRSLLEQGRGRAGSRSARRAKRRCPLHEGE